MKVFLMTDMEGVSGVLNYDDWCYAGSRHYEQGRRLLTEETNSVVAGMLEGGATSVWVVDGHGQGGIDPETLHPDADLLRGPVPGPYPFNVEGSDVIAWVGQHAKAGTEHAHLPHTQGFNVIDLAVNGESIGELGQMAFCAAMFGVAPIFAAGDRALTLEAQRLLPGIQTVAVKTGVNCGGSEHLSTDEYRRAFAGARHRSRRAVLQDLLQGAAQALTRFRAKPDSFYRWQAPDRFRRTLKLRHASGRPEVLESEYPDLLSLMNDLTPISAGLVERNQP